MDDSEISILDSIWFDFLKKNSISNYERFLSPIKDLSDAYAQWLVRLAWPLLSVFQWFIRVWAYNPIWPSSQNLTEVTLLLLSAVSKFIPICSLIIGLHVVTEDCESTSQSYWRKRKDDQPIWVIYGCQYSAVPWITLTILCTRCSHRNQQRRRTISSGSAFMIDNSLYI